MIVTKPALVFIAGSITIKELDPQVKTRIDRVLFSPMEIVVGDAKGADTVIQQYMLDCNAPNEQVTVFCSGTKPRNNLGSWPTIQVKTDHPFGSREFFTAKDLRMASIADYGLMIWDSKSTGTLSNVIELLSRNKKSVVFINNLKTFKKVNDVVSLEDLVTHMSARDKQTANQKIDLFRKIEALKLKLKSRESVPAPKKPHRLAP